MEFGKGKTEEIRRRFMAKIPEGNTLEVYVESIWSGYFSWNHAKIISADGKSVMTGGHNLLSEAYLGEFPVFDISMLAEGHAAYAAQIYLDYLWKYGGKTDGNYVGELARRYLKKQEAVSGRGEKIPMLAAGRGAAVKSLETYYKEAHSEPSDEIFLELFQMAERKICISQQTIDETLGVLPEVIKAWAKAILRGVEIQIVVSCGGAIVKAASGYRGMTPRQVKKKILNELSKIAGEKEAEELINRRIHAANLHYNMEERGYPGKRKEGVPNHAKFVMIDDSVFYIGSQNQYKCNLNEFGIFAESRGKCMELKKVYWDPLWKYSCPNAVTFEDVGEEAASETEAVLFWLELKINKILRKVFTEAREELFGVPEQERDYEELNGIIARAGYETEYRYVKSVMDQPVFREIFAEDKERIQAFRFVRLLLIREGMMRGFLECLQNGLLLELNEKQLLAKLQGWVEEQGFSCRIGAVIGIFQELVDSNLNLWAGDYQMTLANVPEEGGQEQGRCVLTEAEEMEEAVFTVREDGSCWLDKEELRSVQFRDGILCWESGELVFGRFLRSIGPWTAGTMQCEGWIDRQDAQGTVRRKAMGIRLEIVGKDDKAKGFSAVGEVAAGVTLLCSLLAVAVAGSHCGEEGELRERRMQYEQLDGTSKQIRDGDFADLQGELELKELDSKVSRLQESVRQGEPLRQEHGKSGETYEAPRSERETEIQREAWKDWEKKRDRGERPQEERFEETGERIQSEDHKKRLDEEIRRRTWEISGKEQREQKGKEDRRRQEERKAEEQRRLEEERRRKEERHKKRK